MTMSESILAYLDCTDIFERAIESAYGIRVGLPDMNAAMTLRNRMHKARILHRRENAKIYEPGHRMHGRCEYDVLRIRLHTGGQNGVVYMRIEKVEQFVPDDIEDLPPPQFEKPPELKEVNPAKPVQATIASIPRRRITL